MTGRFSRGSSEDCGWESYPSRTYSSFLLGVCIWIHSNFGLGDGRCCHLPVCLELPFLSLSLSQSIETHKLPQLSSPLLAPRSTGTGGIVTGPCWARLLQIVVPSGPRGTAGQARTGHRVGQGKAGPSRGCLRLSELVPWSLALTLATARGQPC